MFPAFSSARPTTLGSPRASASCCSRRRRRRGSRPWAGAGIARRGAAGARDDRQPSRCVRALGRLGVRARRLGRRDGVSRGAGARLRQGRRAGADRSRAALFDLTHGGDKAWGRHPPYGDLGYAAVESAGADFALGTAGAGYGAWTCDLKGGLGSASAVTSRGFLVGALVAVNAAGRTTRGSSPHFWAASYERASEFGGLGEGDLPEDALGTRAGER